MASDVVALAAWWEGFDGPAYPTGPEFAAAFLASDWLAQRKVELRSSIAAEIEARGRNLQTRFDAQAWRQAARIARGDS